MFRLPRLPKPPSLLKLQLACLALCLIAIAGSQFDIACFNRGRAASDNEAMDAYVVLAKQMRHETHTPKAHPAHKSHDAHEVQTVWNAVDGRK